MVNCLALALLFSKNEIHLPFGGDFLKCFNFQVEKNNFLKVTFFRIFFP